MRGITHNQSIQELRINTNLGNQGFGILGDILRRNNNLTNLRFCGSDIGRECAHNIAMALEQCQHNSLRRFDFVGNNVSEEGFAIATSLMSRSQLEGLYFDRGTIGRNGCVALRNTISRWQASNLKRLHLGHNSIDDEGLQVLVESMANCCNLEMLTLTGNRSITLSGLRSMSPLLQSERCSL